MPSPSPLSPPLKLPHSYRRALIHRIPLCQRASCACEICSAHYDAWWPMRARRLGLDSFEVMGSSLTFAGLNAVSQVTP